MAKPFNILFTSAGRRVSLVQCFKKTLADMDIPGNIVVADMQKNAPAFFVADKRELVPRVDDGEYIEGLKAICEKHHIRLLIPLIDTELSILAVCKQEFAAMGVEVLVSSPQVNDICFDKRNTYKFFMDAGIDTPKLYDPEMILTEKTIEYPLFLKPAQGSCSIGATKLKNDRELAFFKEYIPEAIVQEYIYGQEYTLDVLMDFNSKVRSIVPRLRMETRAGEVSKGVTVKDTAVIAAGRKVAEALPGASGCITIQCFKTPQDKIKFIEINPRFGGGFPLSMKAGANFPRWIIEMVLGDKADSFVDAWQENVVMLRYDSEIFVNQEEIL